MIKKILILSFLYIGVFTSFSQKKNQLISGIILDSVSIVKNANIVNLNTKQGTFSDDYGAFTILLSVGDTLSISSIQHISKKILLSKKEIELKKIKIHLKYNTYVLEEFELKKHHLTGLLSADLSKVPQKNKSDINAITLGLPNAGLKKISKIDREIYTASNQTFDLLLNTLSGRLKKMKQKKVTIKQDDDVELMYQKTKYFLTSDFNIKKEDTYRFLYFCRLDTLFNKDLIEDDFKLIAFLQQKSKEFALLKSD